MTRIIYFDIAALALLLPLFVSIIIKRAYKTFSSKIFIVLTVDITLAAIFEILEYLKVLNSNVNLLYLFGEGYFVCRTAMPLIYLIFILEITGASFRFKKNVWRLLLLVAPYLVMFVFIVTNSFSKLLFEFVLDDNNLYMYERRPLLYLAYGISALYLIYGIVLIVKYRKFFGRQQFISVLLILPFTMLSVIVQYFYKDLLVELFATTVALVLVSETIEPPEAVVDDKTGLFSRKKFENTLIKWFGLKKDAYLVVIKMTNFADLYNALTVYAAESYMKKSSARLNKMFRSHDSKYVSYYIGQGIFILNFSTYNTAKIVSDLINKELKVRSKSSIYEFSPKFSIFVTSVIQDFERPSSFISFINSFQNMDKDYFVYDEMKNEKSFIIQKNISLIIDEGLSNNEFEVYYQPIYDVKNNKINSAEALIRLNSKKYGFITPNLFINHAEKNGKIIDIDNFVIEEVSKFIASDEFKKLGIDYIELNLSAVDCLDVELSNRIKKVTTNYKILPSQINLEITETLEADYSIIEKNINELVGYGFKFSLDDYGTGFSNIIRFSKLPIHIVKIDKQLTDAYNDESFKNIIKNTFNMIIDSKRKIVVEGVESKEQVDVFVKYGCDYIQGYYYSKPLPKADFIEYVKEVNLK